MEMALHQLRRGTLGRNTRHRISSPQIPFFCPKTFPPDFPATVTEAKPLPGRERQPSTVPGSLALPQELG